MQRNNSYTHLNLTMLNISLFHNPLSSPIPPSGAKLVLFENKISPLIVIELFFNFIFLAIYVKKTQTFIVLFYIFN